MTVSDRQSQEAGNVRLVGGWLSLADAPADITISSETRFSLNVCFPHTLQMCKVGSEGQAVPKWDTAPGWDVEWMKKGRRRE